MSERIVGCPHCKDKVPRDIPFKVVVTLECFKCHKLYNPTTISKDGMWHTEVTK